MKDYLIGERQKHYGKLWRIVSVLLIVVLLICTVTVRVVYSRALKPVSASQHSVLVTIETGSTASQIAKQLESAGLIREDWAFEWYIRNSNARDRLQAGTYYLRPSQGVAGIVEALTQGKIATNLFTILPGQRLDQIRSALITNGGYTAEEVDKALKLENYADHPALADKPSGATLEGYLFPESFQRTVTTKPDTIIRLSLDEMQKNLTAEFKQAVSKQGISLHEAIVLASIVEQESGNAADKPTIAQVFLKRHRIGMQLGSDVTALYGAIVDNVNLPKGPVEAMAIALAHDSPYNTRKHDGLPPGPISNINKSSLDAVAHPSDTDYLFFVAGDDGKTYFSRTVAEHESLTAQHCKKLCGTQ